MSDLSMNPEALRAAADRLTSSATSLSATSTTCLALDAGEWTAQATALVRSVSSAAQDLASGLAGGAGAINAAAQGLEVLDDQTGQGFARGVQAVRP